MLLSAVDKIRFRSLYVEHSHNEMAVIFNTNREDVIGMAKSLGIYDPNKPKRDIVKIDEIKIKE